MYVPYCDTCAIVAGCGIRARLSFGFAILRLLASSIPIEPSGEAGHDLMMEMGYQNLHVHIEMCVYVCMYVYLCVCVCVCVCVCA